MTKKDLMLLLTIPIGLLLMGIIFFQQISPVYAGANGFDHDPAYVYLLNGLNILGGYPPGHIDHPGTPLQLLSAFIILVHWSIQKTVGLESEGVISSALIHPEFYIQSISFAILILNAWATFYFAKKVFESTKNIKLAIFCQTAPLAFWTVAPNVVYLAPEGLLIFSSLIMLGLLAEFFFLEKLRQRI